MGQQKMIALGIAIAAALPSAAALANDLRDPPMAGPSGPAFAQMVIERRVVIRVTPHPPRERLPISFREWREQSAPKCFPINALAGIVISKPDSIDMVLRGGQLVRARLERGCPSIDFYSGFYLQPTRDGMLCADRDMIHSRTGGACEIERFRGLTPPRQ